MNKQEGTEQGLIRVRGVLTPVERQLAKTTDGIDMVKRLRQNPSRKDAISCASRSATLPE